MGSGRVLDVVVVVTIEVVDLVFEVAVVVLLRSWIWVGVVLQRLL